MDAALSPAETHHDIWWVSTTGSIWPSRRTSFFLTDPCSPQPLRVPRTQGQFCQERAAPQPIYFVPGNSYRLSPHESGQFSSLRLHSKLEPLAFSKRFKGCWIRMLMLDRGYIVRAGAPLWALHLWPLDWSLRTFPRVFKILFLRLEHRLRDTSMPSSGLSSLPGVLPAPQTQWYATYSWNCPSCKSCWKMGHSHSTLKVYVAVIAASHSPINGQSVGRNNLVVRFLKGSRRLNPPHPVTVPTWDLPTVLRAMKSPPFEPLQSVELRPLTLRIALLLALASVKHMGDLHALSGHNHFLVTKQRLSRWIIDTITLVYSSLGQQCPMGVRAHSTRGITSSFLWSSGVSIAEICAAAGWLFICFIIWKFRPYMPESFLYNGLTLVIWQTSMGFCLLLVCSWPSIELWGCTDLFGMITQGRVDLYELDPITFCRASLYNTWSLWATLGA